MSQETGPRVLADANVESVIVECLREDGHDVLFHRVAPRTLDPDVLRRAVRERPCSSPTTRTSRN